VGALVVQFLLWILSACKNKIRGIYCVALSGVWHVLAVMIPLRPSTQQNVVFTFQIGSFAYSHYF
jgi:hypothetical protein